MHCCRCAGLTASCPHTPPRPSLLPPPRLSYYRFADTAPMFGAPRGYDRVRNAVIGRPDFQ